jgi:hypothetical protein
VIFTSSGKGSTVTLNVALALFPAASVAVAVQTRLVVVVTVGAVNTSSEKEPPLVHVVVKDVTAASSVAVRLTADV